MSFNVRYGSANDGENRWDKRKYLVVDTIKQFGPDLLGLQESIAFQTEHLAKHLPDFSHLGTSREIDPKKGESVPIFFRKSRFELIDHGDFWLSENPKKRGSVGWDAACPRIVTWAKFKDRNSKKSLIFVNTHFDHHGKVARLESAKLLRGKVDEWLEASLPIILLGDFNCLPDSKPHQTLIGSSLIDSFRAANPEKSSHETTLSNWSGDRLLKRRIDWVLHSNHFHCRRAMINFTNDQGRYPSDHYPVEAVLSY